MRVFEQGYKINFVDENNVLVGFDWSDSCCEIYSYWFEDKDGLAVKDPGIEGSFFDTSFFETTEDEGSEAYRARFKVTGSFEGFLVLENIHNGFYSHGFEMSVGDKALWQGYL